VSSLPGSRGFSSPLSSNDVTGNYTVDDFFVDRAIDLAWMAAGKTQPNPLVGAVVAKDGRILGVGYHPEYGEDHAETIALERAGESARGSTLYVTLEPCAHHGNTPPCVDQVIESGVSRVVIPTLDPDDRVNGRGVRVLREHGIGVDIGTRADRALLLNMAYFKEKLGLGSAVALKIAVTLDGKIASRPGKRDDITGSDSRRMVHRLRAVHDGVLVGIETFVTDSPRLDCRLLDSVKPPVPIVLDAELKFPDAHPWLRERGAVILTTENAPEERGATLTRSGARVIRCRTKGSSVDIAAAVAELRGRGISSVLVEGGMRVFSSFAEAGVWDAMFVFVSPVLFGPEGVGLADRAVGRKDLGARFAGASIVSGDILVSFINEKTRSTLREHLL
jgi:diaminohydroxyphosphoribosylaminopyrimidine deaminase/5-amino-6-(5-phosphoribosylamino)uracil reductase